MQSVVNVHAARGVNRADDDSTLLDKGCIAMLMDGLSGPKVDVKAVLWAGGWMETCGSVGK